MHVEAVVRKELLTGLFLGLAVVAQSSTRSPSSDGATRMWRWPSSLALLCSCTIATAVAMILPLTLQRLGFDPAFGSGPLATVIQDLLSIVIYFAIGVPLAT